MDRKTQTAGMEAKLDALRRIRQGGGGESTKAVVEQSLNDSHWLVVSEACEVVVQLGLRDLAEQLTAIGPRFCENAVKRDPGCRAKLAALKALDFMELLDPDPFLAAVRYRQFEPSPGGRVDIAGPVRQRALLALMRMAHSKAALFAGELMADDDAQVRAGVAHAIGHYADASALALLAYKLRSGDNDPGVLLECALALLSADFEFGLGLLVPNLSDSDELNRETAALALGQCRDPKATEALAKWAKSVSIDSDHRLAIRALGFSRHDQARHYLLGLIKSGPMLRARAAAEALAVHRYDPQLCQLVRDAAEKRGNTELRELIARLFADTQ
jgi:hypothetical protein